MIAESELVLNPDGSVYHLKLKPGEVAQDILLVGDPRRVDTVCKRFDSVEFIREKREYRTATGRIGNRRITVVGTGIGADNSEIALTEIDALYCLDLHKREPLQQVPKLRFLRLGTCGGLQPEMEPGSLAFSAYALGLDNLLWYYDYPRSPQTASLEAKFNQYLSSLTALKTQAYAAQAADSWQTGMRSWKDVFSGITLTAPGFYGPQGRYIQRAKPAEIRIVDLAAAFRWQGQKVINLEMESSAILGLCSILGHEAAALCTVVANRPHQKFHPEPEKAVEHLVDRGLELILSDSK